MDLTINHITEYSYDAPVDYALQKVRLRPQSSRLQEVRHWCVDVTGGTIETSYLDHYGNHVDLVSMTPGARSLTLRASGTVITEDQAGILGQVYGCAPLWHFCEPTLMTMPGPAIRALPLEIGADPVADLHALSAAILKALPYESGRTEVDTSAEDALSGSHGVCQDHAQIFVAAARLAGLPARYVSGYLMMDDRTEQDATHAWAEAHVEGLGWTGFDISNGVSPDARYVRIATGRDARDAAPVEGLRRGTAQETLMVSLQVQQ